MSEAQLVTWGLRLGIGGLVLLMFFIIFSLSRDSKAGKYGTFVLLMALMMGVLGFAIKLCVEWLIQGALGG
jgi:Protein of unknown function (DUF2788)